MKYVLKKYCIYLALSFIRIKRSLEKVNPCSGLKP